VQVPLPLQVPVVPQVDELWTAQSELAVPAATAPQVPFTPLPLRAAEHAMQVEPQAPLQQ
jgi:hypothetical protein